MGVVVQLIEARLEVRATLQEEAQPRCLLAQCHDESSSCIASGLSALQEEGSRQRSRCASAVLMLQEEGEESAFEWRTKATGLHGISSARCYFVGGGEEHTVVTKK